MYCKCNSKGYWEVRPHNGKKTGLGADRKGISLSELLVVLAIVSLMAAMAVPDLSAYFARREFYSQKDELCAMVNRARDRAIEKGVPWRVIFSPAKKCWFCYGDGNNNNQMDPDEERMGPSYLEQGVSFACHASSGPGRTEVPADGISFADNKVKFSPMGTCNAGTIFLTCKKWNLAIRLYPASGAIRAFEYGTEWSELN